MKLKFLPRGSKQRIQTTNAIAWKLLPVTLVLVLSCSSAFAQDITAVQDSRNRTGSTLI